MKIKNFRWVIILFLIITVTFSMFWIFRNKSIPADEQFGLKEITITVEVTDFDPIMAKHVVIDQALISQDTVQKASIKNLDVIDQTAIITVAASAHYRGPFMTIGGQVIKIGKTYYVKSETLELEGRITNIVYGGSHE